VNRPVEEQLLDELMMPFFDEAPVAKLEIIFRVSLLRQFGHSWFCWIAEKETIFSNFSSHEWH